MSLAALRMQSSLNADSGAGRGAVMLGTQVGKAVVGLIPCVCAHSAYQVQLVRCCISSQCIM